MLCSIIHQHTLNTEKLQDGIIKAIIVSSNVTLLHQLLDKHVLSALKESYAVISSHTMKESHDMIEKLTKFTYCMSLIGLLNFGVTKICDLYLFQEKAAWPYRKCIYREKEREHSMIVDLMLRNYWWWQWGRWN